MKTSTGGRRAASSGTSSVPSTLTSAPHAPDLDGILITWGDRLFYPGNRIVQVKAQPRLGALGAHQRANACGSSLYVNPGQMRRIGPAGAGSPPWTRCCGRCCWWCW